MDKPASSAEFRCGLVLLAAGGSRRMGQPKQLLPVRDRPLVRHVAEQARCAPVEPFVVVVGAEAERVGAALAGLDVHLAVNSAWAEGLGSSLRVGVESALGLSPDLQALLIVLADQPELPPSHLEQLIARYRRGGCTAVASLVGQDPVPPLLFGREWFPRLRGLSGDSGARALLREHAGEVATVALASNADLDTPEDYARYGA